MYPDIDYYVINLAQDTEKLKKITGKLNGLNIPFTRIEGVLGKELNQEDFRDNTTAICNTVCTYSSVGCAMSHIKAWKQISKSNKPGLVLEDDVNFSPDFNNRFKKMFHLVPNDFDIVYVGCYGGCDYNDNINILDLPSKIVAGSSVKTHRKINEHIFVPSAPLALHGYIITPDAARKLVSRIGGNIETHIDMQLLKNSDDLNVYAMSPKLINQDIDTDASLNAESYPISINKVAADVVDKDKFPLSYRLSVNYLNILGFDINTYLIIFIVLASVLGPERWNVFFIAFTMLEIVLSNFSNLVIALKHMV